MKRLSVVDHSGFGHTKRLFGCPTYTGSLSAGRRVAAITLRVKG